MHKFIGPALVGIGYVSRRICHGFLIFPTETFTVVCGFRILFTVYLFAGPHYLILQSTTSWFTYLTVTHYVWGWCKQKVSISGLLNAISTEFGGDIDLSGVIEIRNDRQQAWRLASWSD